MGECGHNGTGFFDIDGGGTVVLGQGHHRLVFSDASGGHGWIGELLLHPPLVLKVEGLGPRLAGGVELGGEEATLGPSWL